MALQTKTLTKDGAKGHHRFTLTVTENSTSVANNSSAVAWSLTIAPIVKGYDWVSNAGKVKYSITINGKTYSGIIASYDGSSTVTIKSGTETVTHSADGSKTLSYSFSITDSTGWTFAPGNASASDTMALTRIPRQATIVKAPNFTDEQNPTITYTNPAGTAVDSLALCITLDGTTTNALPYRAVPLTPSTPPASLSDNSINYTYVLSEEDRAFLRNASPTSNTLKVGFCLRTIIGASQVLDPTEAEYYSKVWATMTIVNADPVFDMSVVDVDGFTELTGGALIRYYSDAKVTTGAKAQKGAGIKSQSITCGGVTIENGSGVGTFLDVGSGEFHCTATDSRGNTVTYIERVPFVDYVKLTCSIGKNKPDTDGNFTLTASGVCFNGRIGEAGTNDLHILYRFKVRGGSYSDWMEMSVSVGDNVYTATANITDLDYQVTYIFQCKAGDLVDAVTTDEIAVKAVPVFDWSGEDFNFNVPVSAPTLSLGGVQVDYIVEQGTKNGWLYRKWHGGLAECWYRKEHTVAITNEWGNLYAGTNATGRTAYPFTFAEKPHEAVTVKSSVPSVFAICSSGGLGDNTTTHTASYNAVRPSAYAEVSTVFFEYYVVGRWK